jgi:hypothetical protein
MSETVKCPLCGEDRDKLYEVLYRADGIKKTARVCVLCAIEWYETQRVMRKGSIAKFEEFWKNWKEQEEVPAYGE